MLIANFHGTIDIPADIPAVMKISFTPAKNITISACPVQHEAKQSKSSKQTCKTYLDLAHTPAPH